MPRTVMLFMFEGESDNSAIAPYITDLVNECNLTLTVEIMKGDKTSGWIEIGGEVVRGEFEWTTSNIRLELIKRIRKHISSRSSIIDLKPTDIYKVYYVTDTDDCFQHPEIPERHNKSKCMRAIFNMGTLVLAPNVEVPIELIFFAKELEHITIDNEEELTLQEKNDKAIEFAGEVLGNEGFFEYTFTKAGLKTWINFQESYVGIIRYVGKACNMNNLLDEISELRRKKLEKLEEEINNIETKIDALNRLVAAATKKELEKLTRQLKNKNFEKNNLKKIIEKREGAVSKYLENNS